MKIAIVRYPINDVGGIDSYYVNLRKGLERLGHEVQFFHANHQTRMKRGHTTVRATIHEGGHLSYRTQDSARDCQAALNLFDVVIMLHPSPHPTRAVLDAPGGERWDMLYDIDPPIIQIHHDENWQKTNSWCSCVADKCAAVVAAQARFLPAVERYPSSAPKDWLYFPLEVPNMLYSTEDHEPFGIVATQWLQWKGHKDFIPMLPRVKTPIHFYGAGIIYHYLKKDGSFDGCLGLDRTDGERHSGLPHEYNGFVPYEEVQEEMSRATFSIDLSTRGYTNMTHWEPLLHGTISMMERRVFEDPHNQIPYDCVCVYDFDTLPEQIADLMADPAWRAQCAENGFAFIQNARSERVAASMLHLIS